MKKRDPDEYLVGDSDNPEEPEQPRTLEWLQHASDDEAE